VEGGWYHITTRGMFRKEIFRDDRDREHFIELLAQMVERYCVVLHAYVLMDNHYHLLIETPEANAELEPRARPAPDAAVGDPAGRALQALRAALEDFPRDRRVRLPDRPRDAFE